MTDLLCILNYLERHYLYLPEIFSGKYSFSVDPLCLGSAGLYGTLAPVKVVHFHSSASCSEDSKTGNTTDKWTCYNTIINSIQYEYNKNGLNSEAKVKVFSGLFCSVNSQQTQTLLYAYAITNHIFKHHKKGFQKVGK